MTDALYDHTGHEEYASLPEPLEGWLAFNQPGEPLTVWDGELHAGAGVISAPGRVTLTWRRRARLRWDVQVDELTPEKSYAWRSTMRETESIGVAFGGRVSELSGLYAGDYDGELHGGSVGDADARLRRLIAHWVCLPTLRDATMLHKHSGARWSTYAGRSTHQTHGWRLTLDARRDLGEVLRQARDDESCVMTHVMEVVRADGSEFHPNEATDLLRALQFAVSFARGQWACPAVPVGHDRSGTPVWTEWRCLHADPPTGGLGWWNETRPEDLWSVVDAYVEIWHDHDRQRTLRHLTNYAISTSETGVVEQRLIAAFTGLELLSWDTHVRERGTSEANWSNKGGQRRVRQLLTEARVPLEVPADTCAALAGYAEALALDDGPAAVSLVRDQLIHPKDPTGLYAVGDVLTEAWLLASRYLELALLHRLGYRGHLVDRTNRDKWAGDSDPAPWTVARSPTSRFSGRDPKAHRVPASDRRSDPIA